MVGANSLDYSTAIGKLAANLAVNQPKLKTVLTSLLLKNIKF
jgi:hypothetical protein